MQRWYKKLLKTITKNKKGIIRNDKSITIDWQDINIPSIISEKDKKFPNPI